MFLQETGKPGFIKTHWIGFPAGREGTLVMRDDVPDRVAGANSFEKFAQCRKLCFGERIRSVITVHKFDADGEVVYVRPAVFHPGFACMPGAILLRDV